MALGENTNSRRRRHKWREALSWIGWTLEVEEIGIKGVEAANGRGLHVNVKANLLAMMNDDGDYNHLLNTVLVLVMMLWLWVHLGTSGSFLFGGKKRDKATTNVWRELQRLVLLSFSTRAFHYFRKNIQINSNLGTLFRFPYVSALSCVWTASASIKIQASNWNPPFPVLG